MNPVANQNKIEIRRASKDISATRFCKIECKKCSDEIYFNTHKKMTPCKCGAIEVDGCEDYVRVIGEMDNCEEVQK